MNAWEQSETTIFYQIFFQFFSVTNYVSYYASLSALSLFLPFSLILSCCEVWTNWHSWYCYG
jgi:hypothetical protein